jgi:hypothetical protein
MCCWTLFVVSILPALVAAEVPLVRDGQPLARIYLAGPLPPPPPAPLPPVKGKKQVKPKPVPVDPLAALRAEAIQELNDHLQRMSGATLEVVVTADPKALQKPAIVLGELAQQLGAKPTKSTYTQEFLLSGFSGQEQNGAGQRTIAKRP